MAMASDDIRMQGVHVMLLEDDALIFMHHEEMLTDMGCRVTGTTTIEEATEALKKATPDVAVLDLDIKGQKSYGVAEVLRSRNVPIIFITGYHPDSFKEEWRADLNVCEKPCMFEELHYLLLKVLKKFSTSDREVTLRPPRGVAS